MNSLRQAIGLVLASVTLAACGVAFPNDDGTCANRVTMNARLSVDDTDPRYIWATEVATGGTVGLRLPGGFGVRRHEIFDPTGQLVARDGDTIVSACWDHIQNAAMIRAEDVLGAGN